MPRPTASLVALLAALPLSAAPFPARAGCFEDHVREAIALNTSRLPVYAAMSGGATTGLSERLIALEKGTLLVARGFDSSAEPYQRAGIDVMCAEFVSMAGAGAPVAVPPAEVPTGLDAALERVERDPRLADTDDLAAVEAAAEELLTGLAADPRFGCMTRHLLESVRRAAGLAPRHEAAARAAGFRFRSPARISRSFVVLQIEALPLGVALDREAAPLQARGIPILCADLPPVPPA